MPTRRFTVSSSSCRRQTPSRLSRRYFDSVAAAKDVDGLASETSFDPPRRLAINWLLAGYNINYSKILVVGNGRLVGKPLVDGAPVATDVTVVDKTVVSLIGLKRAKPKCSYATA